MGNLLGLLGVATNLLPLIITLIILFSLHKFSFINCFLLFLLLNTINESIKMQTKTGVMLNVSEVQRSLIEHNIVNGTVTTGERIIYFIITFFSVIWFRWDFTISAAIFSGIITLIYNCLK